MKLVLITFVALISYVLAAQLPDSATQGPNPQDIATPEPEYIDLDGPLPEGFLASQLIAPAPVAPQTRTYNRISQPLARPQPTYNQVAQHSQPKPAYEVPGHTFNSQTGYSYRRPANYKRFYRRFY